MTTSTTFPNGQTLVSSAYTPQQLNVLMQGLTLGMLGLDLNNPSLVRVDWQTQGQPFADVGTDVCYVACVPQDVEYSRIREMQLTQSAGPVLTENWTYTKGWKVSWTMYGPNSEDRARTVRSCMFLDYFNGLFNLINLFPLPDPQEVTRLPQNINGEWWERADFSIVMYENVTETIQDGVVSSVEVKLQTKDGLAADFTVEK